jgi:ABC-2 type transport system ATP-binding protein
MILSIENLTKKFNNLTAVNTLSLNIENPEILAIIGPNGAGKTTTIKNILGLQYPTSGQINYKGTIAYLPENKELYDSYTVEKMVKITKSYTENFDEDKAYEYLKKFKIDKKYKIKKLSHGMKTMTYLSLLFAQDADIYIMDEPTWGLDSIMRNKVFDMIRELSYEEKTIIYTSHVLQEVEKIADEVAIMKNGEIIERCLIDDLKEKYVAVVKKERTKGFLWKKVGEKFIYIEKRNEVEDNYEKLTFDNIFEALIEGEKIV